MKKLNTFFNEKFFRSFLKDFSIKSVSRSVEFQSFNDEMKYHITM